MAERKKKNAGFADNFTLHLEQWQKENHKTQDDFAELVGVRNRESVSKWKSGVQYPSAKVMKKIEKVLGVTEEELHGNAHQFHDFRYLYSSQFTREMHADFDKYIDGIGLSHNFMKFIKENLPDEDFPIYSPITSDYTNPEYHRKPIAKAFKSESTNEYQRTVKNKTVNLGYADYMFLSEVQKSVILLVQFMYYKRSSDMEFELKQVKDAYPPQVINGVKIYDSLTADQLMAFDPYMQYQTAESINAVLERKNHGEENR